MPGMRAVLPTLSVAFIAFCIWLTVRIINRRERWAKRTAACVGVLVPTLYLLGTGPVVWLADRDYLSDSMMEQIDLFYLPLERLYDNGSPAIRAPLDWYLDFWGD
jgi:hypothetical protein